MSDDREWKLLASYEFGYEVDFAEARLKSAGIPVVVKGREAGIWGPGFAGPASQGLSVWVPDDQMQDARELLEPGPDLDATSSV